MSGASDLDAGSGSMDVIDLTDELCPMYFCCLEDWAEEMQEAGDHKDRWYEQFRDRGLRVKLARADDGTIGGMIQYLPIEHAFAEGSGLYMVLCIWVHGYKQGVGNHQKRGMGRAMLAAAEADAVERGAKGMAAWGLGLPIWMKASWFRRRGYRVADREGLRVLLWKPFSDDAEPPRWIRGGPPVPVGDGPVRVTAFLNGWCPAQNIAFERMRRAAAEFGDDVVFERIDTAEKAAMREWGQSDALFIDGRSVRTGPPPSYDRLRRRVARAVRKARRAGRLG